MQTMSGASHVSGVPDAHETASIDTLEDAEAWLGAAVAACLAAWERTGRRYERRLEDRDRVRDPVADVMALAARRVVPLRRRVVRPLPSDGLSPLELAFNTLDPADRYALCRLELLAGGRARGEHLASALTRLLAAEAELEAAAAVAAGTKGRPPP